MDLNNNQQYGVQFQQGKNKVSFPYLKSVMKLTTDF